jgi:serine/threonine protein kinase
MAAKSDVPSAIPKVIAGRYRVLRLIARGGMGAVYEVEHTHTGQRHALKVLLARGDVPPELIARFKREARASANIKSEHVVRVTDADVAAELGGAPFLVMELLEGQDLETLAALSRPEPPVVVDWLRQVASALDKAHRLGIVHRDIKPENLFLARSPDDRPAIVKVLDFGIVKMTEDATGITASGEVLGTPQYMAPEQATASTRITAATDRYALGLVAYRLLAGESYYQGDVMHILAQLLHEAMRRPSQLHPELGPAFDAWFARACHRDPEARFPSAGEQIEALAAALSLPVLVRHEESGATSSPGYAKPPESSTMSPTIPFTPPPKQARPLPVGVSIAIAILLVAGLVIGVVVQRSSTGTAAPPAAAGPRTK